MSGLESRQHLVDDAAPYGAYALGPAGRLLLSLCRNTPLGRGKAKWMARDLIVSRHGKIVDASLYGSPARFYLEGNLCEWKAFIKPDLYDPTERRLIAQAMDRPNAVFLDIGANVGVYSIAAARAARADARIVAFEPHPVTFRRLKFNADHCRFHKVEAMQMALGDHDGVAHIAADDLSLSSVLGAGGGVEVPMRRLLTCLADLKIDHIDVLKIDVEGYEDHVLGDFLDHAPDALIPRTIIIEDLGRHLWRRDCIDMLLARGMKITGRKNNNTFLSRD